MATSNVDPNTNEKTLMDHEKESRLQEEDVERHALSLRGKTLTAALALVAGTGFTLFGYAFCTVFCNSLSETWIFVDMIKASCRHC